MNRICNGKPDPIATTRSLVHPKRQAIIMRLLEHNPKKRFQSADDLAAEIENFIADLIPPFIFPCSGASCRLRVFWPLRPGYGCSSFRDSG